jgi:hypothetical protein
MRDGVDPTLVVPANAGTQWRRDERRWAPAFAGATEKWRYRLETIGKCVLPYRKAVT